MPDFVAPNVLNYQIPKGKVFWTPEGGTRRSLGNTPSISFEPTVEKQDHFSQREGIRKKDFAPVVAFSGVLAVVLDEINEANLKMALLGGTSAANTAGNNVFTIGAVTEVRGMIEIEGSNDIGPRYTATFPKVTFAPSSAIDFVGDDYTELELEGEVTFDETLGGFGTIELQDTATA